MKRANIGAGSIQPDDWVNFDAVAQMGLPSIVWDVRKPAHPSAQEAFDYAVCSFMLQELDHHEIPGALDNMLDILKPGGVLRILVPNVITPFLRYGEEDEAWFPQDDRTGGLDAKFCTMLVWYGTVRSVFTHTYLVELLGKVRADIDRPRLCLFGQTSSSYGEIVRLDSRAKEALIVEVTKR